VISLTGPSWGVTRKTIFLLLIFAAIIILAVSQPALSCDVAVVSGKYTTDGKPILWKSFDCSSAWPQQVKYFEAKNPAAGDYFLLYHYDDYMELINDSPVMPQSGANEAGFAASVAAVYEDLAPLHESGNLNTDLVQDAVEQCATLEDFESLLKTWPSTHRNHAISANFVVVDAHGGAALYECYTGKYSLGLMYIQYRKYDANTGKVTNDKGNTVMEAPADHPGFINRTNLNYYVWYNSGVDRYLRAKDLLTDLADKNKLNAKNLMQVVSKDVTGKQADGNGDTNYSTTYCISRNQTRSGTVFQGVAPGDDPLKSVYWTALGEPSVAVYFPNMIGAGSVSEYAYMDTIGSNGVMKDSSDNALLTIAEDKLEISAGIHTNNRGSVFSGPYNKYINKTALANVQQWTFPLEDTVIARTDEFISQLDSDPSLITGEYLKSFTDYCGKYIYENYTAASAEAVPWTFGITAEPAEDPVDDTTTEPADDTTTEPADDTTTEPADDTTTEPIAVPAHDKSVLKALILTATIDMETAVISVKGSEVTPAEQWVTWEERIAYQTAINAATAVAQDSDATQAEVDQAVINLRAATAAFYSAKEAGTKSGVTFSGRVFYKERLFKPRDPVEGAKIYIQNKGKLYAAYSDAKGNFELITDLPAGFYSIYCTHPQYGQLSTFQFIGLFNYYEFLYTI